MSVWPAHMPTLPLTTHPRSWMRCYLPTFLPQRMVAIYNGTARGGSGNMVVNPRGRQHRNPTRPALHLHASTAPHSCPLCLDATHPPGTVNIITGSAGCVERHEPFTLPQPSYTAYRNDACTNQTLAATVATLHAHLPPCTCFRWLLAHVRAQRDTLVLAAGHDRQWGASRGRQGD